MPGVCEAGASTGGTVLISPAGGGDTVEVDLGELPGGAVPDVGDRTFENVVTPAGHVGTVTVTGAYSLHALLGYGGIAPSSYTVAEIEVPNAPPLLLSSAEVTSQGTAPVVWKDATGLHVLVPSAGSSPVQTGETFTTVSSVLTVNLHSGALLTVEASSSVRSSPVGKPVRFAASATGALPGESLSYHWYFDDGSGALQPSTSHAYIVAGTYDVYMTVIGSQDSVGISPAIPIQVGRAPRGPKRQGGGTNKVPTAPTHGPGLAGAGGSASPAPARVTPPGRTRPPSGAAHLLSHAVHRGPSTALAQRSRTAQRMLRGVVVTTASPLDRRSPRDRGKRAGAARAARTGHLALAHLRSLVWLWIALAAAGSLLGGALLELGPRWHALRQAYD